MDSSLNGLGAFTEDTGQTTIFESSNAMTQDQAINGIAGRAPDFQSSGFSQQVLSASKYYLRWTGGKTGTIGRFLTSGSSPAELNLPDTNSLESLYLVRLEAGSTIYQGLTLSGGNQINIVSGLATFFRLL